jgi:uncharacterized RDD family membrane protein YckC
MIIIAKRALAFFIDIAIVATIMLPICFVYIYFNLDVSIGLAFGAISFLLSFCKDLFSRKGSIGKKYMGLKLKFDSSISAELLIIYKIIRNIPLVIWPLEVFVAVMNRGTRIGDMIVGSEVILIEHDK